MQEVKDGLSKLPCDQLHIEFYKYPQSHLIGQSFFLAHKEYTHYLIASTDVIPEFKDWKYLTQELIQNDYDVYGPCQNVDNVKWKNHIIGCNKLPKLEFGSRLYNWISESQRQWYLSHNIIKIPVKFNGLAFSFIRRNLIEIILFGKTPYKTKAKPSWEMSGGWACDLAFMHYCDYLDYEVILDLKVKWQHNRFGSPNLVGKRTPNVKYYNHKANS